MRGKVHAVFVALAALPMAAGAALLDVPSADFPTLSAALASCADGDAITVRGGVQQGPFVIERQVDLRGEDGAVLDGGGTSTVVTVKAKGVRISGFSFQRSGSALDSECAGVTVAAPGGVIESNHFSDVLFGINLSRAPGSVVRGNTIRGLDVDVPMRGDTIRLWYSDDVLIEGNTIEHGRDLVVWYSSRVTLRGNVVSGGRYGMHFMYCDDATIESNRLFRNSVGVFLMYSSRLRMLRNTVAQNRGPSGYALGLKDMDDVLLAENLFVDNRMGVHIDGTPTRPGSEVIFRDCVVAFNDIGVGMMPSVHDNQFTGNSFIDNHVQVAVLGGGELRGNVWTRAGRGNYWSDYAGFDADGDRIGDIAYREDRLFETVADRKPLMRFFTFSFATETLDFAARAFPVFKPTAKLEDASPLMAAQIPHGLPVVPRASPVALGAMSAVLLGSGLGCVAIGRARRRVIS